MSWYKALFTPRTSKLENKLREWLNIPSDAYKQWKRRLRQKHRWLFEVIDSIFLLPLIVVYIAIGALGLLEVATRSSETGRGVICPYYSKYWDAIGGIMDFSKEGFYEFIYWTAGAILLFGLFLLYATFKKNRDTAYADGQLTASERVPDASNMQDLNLMKELNDIMHVLYEVYPRPLEDWAKDIVRSSDPSGEYVLWRRITNVYKNLSSQYETSEGKEALFWTIKVYVDGTKRPAKIRRVLSKEGHDISFQGVKEIIAAYEAERERLFLRM
jgi:hypothetical protein